MKRFLPLIVLILGALVLVAVFFVIKGRKPANTSESEETVAETPFEKRPVASLTPSADGHWLKLKIDKMGTLGKSLDYELLYSLPDGRTQGVPGTIDVSSISNVERDLLLGSESSGKFRYDEGVKEGTLTLKFRDSKGHLTAKFSTTFSLFSGTDELVSNDQKFKYILDKVDPKAFFLVMETFGAPEGYPAGITSGPYGVFSVKETKVAGKATFPSGKIQQFASGKWSTVTDGKSQTLGIFVASSE